MAVINLALKYAEKAIERFYHESITDAAFDKSRDSEFVGVKTVRIYDIGTAPVNDYQRSGTSRYGSVDELSDSVQELQMTQDKSSTWSIDKGNQKEQFNVKQAGETLLSAVVSTALKSAAYAGVYVVSFLLLLLLLRLVLTPLHLFTKLPVVHGVNALLGGVLGLVKCALLLFLAVWVLQKLQLLVTPELVNKTVVLKFFAQNSPIDLIAKM